MGLKFGRGGTALFIRLILSGIWLWAVLFPRISHSQWLTYPEVLDSLFSHTQAEELNGEDLLWMWEINRDSRERKGPAGSPPSPSHSAIKSPLPYHLSLKANRRWGEENDKLAKSYSGSPWAFTQRLRVEQSGLVMGLTVDKDWFEPRYDDLVHFWVQNHSHQLHWIAGDYQVSAGLALCLGVIPIYYSLFPSEPIYQDLTIRLYPSGSTLVNRNLRGIAAHYTPSARKGELLICLARTPYDVLVNSDGSLNRFSDSGLHRSPGEDRKRGSATGSLVGGGIMSPSLSFLSGSYLTLGLSGYFEQLSSPLQPPPDPRIPFPLRGSHWDVKSLFGQWEMGTTRLMGEIAQDRMGKASYGVSLEHWLRDRSLQTQLLYVNIPPQFQNPHLSPPQADNPNNLNGLFSALNYYPDHLGKLRSVVFQFGRVEKDSRTYTIPQPHKEARYLLESRWARRGEEPLKLRFSQQWDAEKVPREERFLLVRSERFRVTKRLRLGEMGDVHTSTETVFQRRESRYLKPSAAFFMTFFSALLPIKSSDQMETHAFWVRWSMSLKVATGNPLLSFYPWEYDIPQRLRTVRLNGNQWRWSWGWEGKWKGWHLGGGMAQTRTKKLEKGDLEGYIALSYTR